LVPEEATPYVGEALTRLREEVGNQSTVLGFVGAPFTLACYIVEGESSKMYTHMKTLMFKEPAVLHALLDKLADSIADYVRYQVPPPPATHPPPRHQLGLTPICTPFTHPEHPFRHSQCARHSQNTKFSTWAAEYQ
jgi:hypothetical protein